jgi:hypothetical protein
MGRPPAPALARPRPRRHLLPASARASPAPTSPPHLPAPTSPPAGTPEQVEFTPVTHQAAMLHAEPGSVRLRAMQGPGWDNKDFECAYRVWGDAIVACVTLQPPTGQVRAGGEAGQAGVWRQASGWRRSCAARLRADHRPGT